MNNRKLFRNILKLARQNLKLQFVGFIFVIIHSIAVLLSPIASGYLIDKTLESKNISDMLIGVGCFCSAIICQPIFGFFKDIIYMNIALDLKTYNSMILFKKIIYAPMLYFDKTPKGEILSKIINDTKEVSDFVLKFFTFLIKNLFLALLIMVCMFCISVKITSIVLVLLIVFFLINKKLNDQLEDLSMQNTKTNDLIYSQVARIINEILSIKCFCSEEYEIENYKNALDQVRKTNRKRDILAIMIKNFSTLVIMISLSVIYFMGCMDVLNGKTTVGNVISLGLYYQLIMGPLFEIVGCIIDINNIKPIFKRFNEIEMMDGEKQYGDSDVIYHFDKVNSLHIRHVFFGYNDKNVLNDLCLDTPDKGYIGIFGKSGEGKSTLLKLIMGLYKTEQGEISIGEIGLREIGYYNLRKKVVFVPQEVNLFSSSIRDNFFRANKKLSYQEMVELCKMVNMHENIMSMNEKYETTISEMINISGGEKQRIGIAMAIAKKSSIILLDEPTSALDSANEELIVKLLKELSKEKLVIVISHKESTLKNSDKLYFMQNGKLIEKDKIM